MSTITQGQSEHLRSLDQSQIRKLRRDSVKALRNAWPQRHSSFRAPHVVRANVRMLRNLESLGL